MTTEDAQPIKLPSRARLEDGAFELLKAAERAEYFMRAMAGRLSMSDREKVALADLQLAIIKARGW
jgi:hypothetical protein